MISISVLLALAAALLFPLKAQEALPRPDGTPKTASGAPADPNEGDVTADKKAPTAPLNPFSSPVLPVKPVSAEPVRKGVSFVRRRNRGEVAWAI